MISRVVIALLAYAISAAAAAETFPHLPTLPPEAKNWVRPEDYPAKALQANESGVVYVRLIIAPDGRPETCTPVLRTKSKILADISCSLLMKRATFGPAEDQAGHPVYGAVTRWFSWTTGSRAGSTPSRDWIVKALPADVDITVKALPAGMGKSADMHVALAIGSDGRASGFAHPGTASETAALANIACKRLAAESWSPLHDPVGNAVPSVQQVLVRFSATS